MSNLGTLLEDRDYQRGRADSAVTALAQAASDLYDARERVKELQAVTLALREKIQNLEAQISALERTAEALASEESLPTEP